MALDPSLALQGKPLTGLGPDWASINQTATTNQNIINSQYNNANTAAGTANLQAQNPGLQATSQQQQIKAQQDQIALQTQQAVIAANKAASTVNPDGTTTYNPLAAANYLNSQGYADAGYNLLKTSASTASDQIKSLDDARKFGDSYATTTASMLSSIQDPAVRAQHAAVIQQEINQSPQLQTSLGASPLMSLLTEDPSQADAIKAGSITPEKATELRINLMNANSAAQNAQSTAESVRQAGLASLTGPDATDPTKPISISYTQAAIDAGIPGAHPGMSAYEVSKLPGASSVIENLAVPSGIKASAAALATQSQTNANLYENAVKAAAKFNIPNGTNLTAWIGANVDKLGNDPAFRTLQSAVQAADPTGQLNLNMGSAGIASVFQNKANLERQNAATQNNIISAKTWGDVGNTIGNLVNGSNSPGSKSFTKAQVQEYATRKGLTVDQVLQTIKSKGGTVQ